METPVIQGPGFGIRYNRQKNSDFPITYYVK